MKLDSVLVVHKQTAYERYCVQDRDPRVLQLFTEDHITVQELHKAHIEHRETLEKVGAALDAARVSHRFVRRADFRETRGHDLVISLGGDGTFLATSHHVRDTPMLGVNSTPSRSAGAFCAATAKTFRTTLTNLLKDKLKAVELNRMTLELNGRAIAEPVLNEVLVCHQNPAAVARYILEIARRKEHQKSAGIFVGTAAGSTAVMRGAGGSVIPLAAKKVQYVVRGPYAESGRLGLQKGIVPPKAGLKIHSKMRTGMIYIDGPHERRRFDFGDVLHVIPEGQPLIVYGIKRGGKK